jgi:thiol-disulfide isomerase/thioredoxin
MPDLTVPAVLAALVLLILFGQWIVRRRAQSMRGQTAPPDLFAAILAHSPVLARESPDVTSMNALIEFGSPHCGACRQMAPALSRLGAQYPGRIVHLSVLDHRGLTQTLRIMGTPTLVLVKNGEIAEVFVGITSQSRLAEQLKRHWPAIAPINPTAEEDA